MKNATEKPRIKIRVEMYSYLEYCRKERGMADIFKVLWSKATAKQLENLPENIVRKFYAWVIAIRLSGLNEVRKSQGFHDKSLKGNRRGQRSVRLNKAYRAIYIEKCDGTVEFIEVIEVNKHEY
jgi:proteic killer suppression protein